MNIKYFISYSGLIPFFYLIIDGYFLGYLNLKFINDLAILMSCIIFTFIGAYNWDFRKDNIYLEIYGFLPSLFSMIVLFLNLIEYNQVLIFNLLIILFLIQLSIDLFLSLKNYFPIDYFIKLRIPITSSLSLSLLFISKL